MDAQRFDGLTRSLTARNSRRGTLRLLAGAALGALAGTPVASALAKPKQKKSGCPKKPCPAGKERDKRTCKCECKRKRCSGGKEFDPKSCRCKCPRGMRECRDGCVALGQCCPGDPPCPEDPKGCCYSPGLEVCTIDGCCAELDGKMACNDFCVDTNTNRHHCGGCGLECESDEDCVDGACAPAACPTGRRCNGGCCAEGKSCCRLKDGGEVCCAEGRCLEPGLCCAADAVVRCSGQFAHCAPPTNVCCGEHSCPNCTFCRVAERRSS